MTKVVVKNNIQKNSETQANEAYPEKLTQKGNETKLRIKNRPINNLERDLERDLEKDLKTLAKLGLNETQIKIISEIIKNHKITQKQLAVTVGINERNIRNNIEVLKQKGIVERIGPDKGGYWGINIISFRGD